jgi:hypothetical protein
MVEIEHELENIESWDPGGGGKLIPGIYEVKIVEVKGETAQSGHPKLNIKCSVVDGDHIGSICFADRSLHPNALGYFRGMLDILNLFATGRSFDEQKLVGRFMKVQVVEYTKQDQSVGLKVDKLFRSGINDHKNEQCDISEGAHTTTVHPPARPNGNGNGKPAAAKPPAKPAAPAPAKPAAASKQPARASAPPVHSDDDLPFVWFIPFVGIMGEVARLLSNSSIVG